MSGGPPSPGRRRGLALLGLGLGLGVGLPDHHRAHAQAPAVPPPTDSPEATVRAWIDAHHAWNDRAWQLSERDRSDAGADRIAADFQALLRTWFEGRSPRRDLSFGTDPMFHRERSRIVAVTQREDTAVVRVEKRTGPGTDEVQAHDIELVRSAGRWRLAAIYFLDVRERLRQY